MVLDVDAIERALVEEQLAEALAAGDKERVSQLNAALARLAGRQRRVRRRRQYAGVGEVSALRVPAGYRGREDTSGVGRGI